MTIAEHAKQIYDRVANKLPSAVVDGLTPYSGKCWLEAAYDELRAELDAERAKPKADPDLDRIKRERGVAHTALNQIHTAFGDPRRGPFNPTSIAERAIKVIKEWREKQPEPPKKAVYEWVYGSAPSKWTVLTLFRNSCAAGRILAADGSVLYFVYPNFIERRNERDTQPYSASSIESAKAAVEAVVRAHFGDEV